MTELWWRGQSTVAPPTNPGAYSHDFGDGIYFTDQRSVAEVYADRRVDLWGGKREVMAVITQRGEMGRVLDLNASPKWDAFLNEPYYGGQTRRAIILRQNDSYYSFFREFCSLNKIKIENFDAVVGPEYVLGGRQMAILHKDGRPSPLALKVKARLQTAYISDGPRPPMVRANPNAFAVGMPMEPWQGRGVLSNQAAVAMFGQLLAGAIQNLGSWLVQKRVEEELETTYAEAVKRHLDRGDGVLVIIGLEERIIPDVNGFRNPMLISINIQNGQSQDAALAEWRGLPRLLVGAHRDYRIREEYIWIEPRF